MKSHGLFLTLLMFSNFIPTANAQAYEGTLPRCEGTNTNSWSNCVGEARDGSDAIYSGEWLNGLLHGRGVVISHKENVEYRGDIKFGKWDGQGTLHLPEGTYRGNFKEGKYHGYGTLYLTNGHTYEGEFREGAMHGRGTIFYPNNKTLSGEWENNKFVNSSSRQGDKNALQRPNDSVQRVDEGVQEQWRQADQEKHKKAEEKTANEAREKTLAEDQEQLASHSREEKEKTLTEKYLSAKTSGSGKSLLEIKKLEDELLLLMKENRIAEAMEHIYYACAERKTPKHKRDIWFYFVFREGKSEAVRAINRLPLYMLGSGREREEWGSSEKRGSMLILRPKGDFLGNSGSNYFEFDPKTGEFSAAYESRGGGIDVGKLKTGKCIQLDIKKEEFDKNSNQRR